MNLVDYLILGVLLVSMLFGAYRGFVCTLADCFALGLALLIGFYCYPLVSGWIAGHQNWLDFLIYLSEGSSHIPLEMTEFARTPAELLAEADVVRVVESAAFTAPFDGYLLDNLLGRVFSPELSLVSEYFDQTIADASLNMLSFVLLSLCTYIIASFLVYLMDQTFHFPVLRALDGIFGIAVGVARGFVLLMLAFVLVPLVVNFLQIGFINDLVEQSRFAGWFLPDNWFFAWIKPFV